MFISCLKCLATRDHSLDPAGASALAPGVSLAPPKRGRSPKPREALLPSSKAPRVLCDQAQARMDHNKAVRSDRTASEAARAVYLKRNIDKLAPFITQQVRYGIMSVDL